MREWLTWFVRLFKPKPPAFDMAIKVRPTYCRTGAEQYVVTCERFTGQPFETVDHGGETAWVERRKDKEGDWYWFCYRHRKTVGCHSPVEPPCIDLKAVVDGLHLGITGEQSDD